jgi:VWFA-related protein
MALVLASGVPSLSSQQPQPQPQRAPGTLTEGVTAVLVDVVVRDRRGQPVRDLTQEDFAILEDGVPQVVGAFTPVFDGAIAAPTPAAPVAALPAPPAATVAGAGGPAPAVAAGPLVTALVFHGLSPEGRRRAVRAAQNYVGDREELANYIGIFGIDLSLSPLAPFTRNGIAVRQALHAMATGGTSGFNSPEQQQQRASAEQQAAVASQAAAAGAAAGGPGASNAVGTNPGAAQLAMMQARAIEEFQGMERDQQGYIATDALFAIVRTLGRLPGRKSLVLFSEGLSVPPAVHRLFLGVIDAANRANVSIYTVDAAGLRAESDQAVIRDRVNQAASVGIESGYSVDGAGGAYTDRLETNEYNLRSDPQAVLGQLAQETGGLLFSNSNNLRPAFERVESDLRNYYMLGYTPKNTTFDGRFRNIEVRVRRPNLTVSARRGYFAVRDPGGSPVNAWEAPALGALESRPVPNAFPVRASALLFPERGRPGLVPVLVHLRTEPLSFFPAPDGKTYTSDFTVLVRFLDHQNQVVRKVSQHYEIRGDIAQMDRAKGGEVLFYRESELPPGVYTMETVVHDAPSGKASVRFSTVEVPQHLEGRLRMSSLVIVQGAEQVPEKERRPGSPLLVNGVALTPNLGDPVSRTAKEVAFYFSVYPASGGRGPDVRIELLHNGKPAAQLPMPVPPADEHGRIQQLGRLPIANLAPGTYELRALVKQGDEQAVRTTLIRITD